MSVKPRTNLLLDTGIMILFVAVLLSGLLLWTVYPAGGTRAGRGHGDGAAETAVLALDKHTLVTAHEWGGVIVGLLVLLHLLFHWKWITCQAKRVFAHTPPSRRTPARACTDAPCPDA